VRRVDPQREPDETRVPPRAEVVPFALTYFGVPVGGLTTLPEFTFFRLLALVLLLIACGNVAMLMFARTATRFREIAVRTALGASRARVVSQLVVEALVVSLVATGLGLSVLHAFGTRVLHVIPELSRSLPYWLTLEVTGGAVGRALGFAVLSAVIAGVLPAWRLTGRDLTHTIGGSGSGARHSGIRFGGVTGALIVLDVAVSIAAFSFALQLVGRITDGSTQAELTGIPAEEYLAVELRIPRAEARVGDSESDDADFRQRLAATLETVVARIEAEPGVRSVAIADALPRMDHRSRPVELRTPDGVADPQWMRTARVDVDFFTDLDHPIVAGRGFTRTDLAGGPLPVIVNTAFVERVLDGRDPLGQVLRFRSVTGAQEAWHEIVGVVGHLGIDIESTNGNAGVYLPAEPGTIHPVYLGIHLGGDPDSFAPRLREIVAETDPVAVLGTPTRLSEIFQGGPAAHVGMP
jgi:hypothetical protein